MLQGIRSRILRRFLLVSSLILALSVASRADLFAGRGMEDPDQDGLPTGLEEALFTDPLNADTDGDSFPDGVEVAADSSPLLPHSVPQVASGVILHAHLAQDPDGVPWVAVILTFYSSSKFEGLEEFHIYGGKGDILLERTHHIMRTGRHFRDSSDQIHSIGLQFPIEMINDGKVTVLAEFTEYGQSYRSHRAFGFHNEEFFVQDFVRQADGFIHGYLRFQDFPAVSFWLPNPPGGVGEPGGVIPDRVFVEVIARTRLNGMVIETVVDNRCDEEPGQRCPTDRNTVGSVRIGPAGNGR